VQQRFMLHVCAMYLVLFFLCHVMTLALPNAFFSLSQANHVTTLSTCPSSKRQQNIVCEQAVVFEFMTLIENNFRSWRSWWNHLFAAHSLKIIRV